MLLAKDLARHSNESGTKLINQLVNANINALYADEDKALLKLDNQHKAQASNNGICFLQPEFKAEALAETFLKKHYLDIEARKAAQVTVRRGKFLDAKRKALWGEYIFGLLPDNRLYALPVKDGKHHSHILAGLPAKAVGHAHFVNGKLITLSNNSGHYKPTATQMRSGIEWFYNQTGYEFVFEDHQRFSNKLVNNGLRYSKASEIHNSSEIQEFTYEMSPEALSDLIEQVIENSGNSKIAQDENNLNNIQEASNPLVPYGIMVSDEEELASDTELESGSDSDSEECQFTAYDDNSTYYYHSAESTFAAQPSVRRAEEIRFNLIFTHALNGRSRFLGTKDLERFKAKDRLDLSISNDLTTRKSNKI